MGGLSKDLRFALRQIARRPGFSAVIVLSLALAISANAAIFSLVNTVLLGSVGAPEPDRLVAIYTMDEKNPGHLPVSDLNAWDLDERTDELLDVAFYTFVLAQLGDGEDPEPGLLVNGEYFTVLGLQPELGRFFSHPDRELGAHPEIVISHELWHKRFGSDPEVIGRVIEVNEHPMTVVGVAPEGFHGTTLGKAHVFAPYSSHRELMPRAPFFENRRFLAFFPIARLAPGADLEQVNVELERLGEAMAKTYPVENGKRWFKAVPMSHALLGPDQRDLVIGASALMLTVVGFILLIACANAANLMLARAATRRSEVAVRQVLGASPGRIVRQLLTESLLLAGLAAGLGLALAVPLADGLWSLRPQNLPFAGLEPRIDLVVLGYTTALAMLAGLLFGLAPALRASRVDLIAPLKEETSPGSAPGRRLGLRSILVVAQVALSAVALVGAGLFVRSMDNARQVDPGFGFEALVLADIDMSRLEGGPQRQATARAKLVSELEALPEIDAAAVGTHAPFGQNTLKRTVFVDGRHSAEADGVLFDIDHVGPGYFGVLEQRLLAGRQFDERDDERRGRVAIVNQAFARRYWPDQSPVGERLRFMGEEEPLQIVGVVQTAKFQTLTEDPLPVVYVPLDQWPQQQFTLFVRTDDPEGVGPSLAAVAARQGSSIRAANARSMSTQMEAALFGPWVAAVLLGSLGAVALVLALIGLYAVMTFNVRQRRREIGIRMALGASPRDVRSFVMLQAMTLVAFGLGIGMGGALLVQDILSPLLFEVPWGDLVAFAGAAALLAGLSFLAAWLPALHATRISPNDAMRHD